MNDKELLELAAKAAGINSDYWEHCGWSSLSDDGDALRLAVKLGLGIRFYLDGVGAGEEYEMNNEDPYAATRRAIVRAAAEIGRQMK